MVDFRKTMEINSMSVDQKIKPRPSRKLRATTRLPKVSVEDKLLAAIQRLLAENKSFGTLSVEQLASEAGLSRGTFYVHFKDKNDLVVRLVEYLTDQLVTGLGNWGLGLDWASKEDVHQAVEGVVRCFYEHRAIVVAIRDTMSGDPEIRKLYENMIMQISIRAQDSVGRVLIRGDAREGMTRKIGNALTWIVALCSNDIVDRGDEAALQELIESLQFICVATIFKD